MVYQGLGVYREPVQRPSALALPSHFGALPGGAAVSSLPSLDSIPYAHRGPDTGTPLEPRQSLMADFGAIWPWAEVLQRMAGSRGRA